MSRTTISTQEDNKGTPKGQMERILDLTVGYYVQIGLEKMLARASLTCAIRRADAVIKHHSEQTRKQAGPD